MNLMSENCSHNCGSCSSNCGSRKPADFLVPPNEHSKIKKVIAVVSGKGGVGKRNLYGSAPLMKPPGKARPAYILRNRKSP